LLTVANQELPRELRAKLGASDVVQDTLLEAQRDLFQFAGQREEILLSWLRRMLLNNLANLRRSYQQTEKRQVAREISLEGDPAGQELQQRLAAPGASPSSEAARNEEAGRVDRALARLPEHFRRVIELRYRDNKSFAEIGETLGRSPEAVRKLWARAVERLQEEMGLKNEEREQEL
jgi:RNA polymerase sigma-70 factor (ECF subfamily)